MNYLIPMRNNGVCHIDNGSRIDGRGVALCQRHITYDCVSVGIPFPMRLCKNCAGKNSFRGSMK